MKVKNILLLILTFMLIGYTSCIKEYLPRTDKYDHLLVVNGAITDQPGPYTVALSLTSDLAQRTTYQPYANCIVEINDNAGNSEVLTEVSPGIYKTDSLGGIQGIVGRDYKLKIIAPDGQVYKSDAEKLKSGIGIRSLVGKFENEDNLSGYRFYITTEHYSLADSIYFYWSAKCTYKFQTDYKIYFYYEDYIIKRFPRIDSLHTGYRTQAIPGIYTFNPFAQAKTQAVNIPLNYEDTHSNALTMRYCLTVNQYTLNQKQYLYWNTIKKMKESQGSLYSQQPYQIKGNIYNIKNPDNPVLGYFMVVGMSQKRTFVDGLPSEMFHLGICTGLVPPVHEPFWHRLLRAKPKDWPVYITLPIVDINGNCVDGTMAGFDMFKSCVDCRIEGVLEKPSFWVD